MLMNIFVFASNFAFNGRMISGRLAPGVAARLYARVGVFLRRKLRLGPFFVVFLRL